MEEQKGYVSRAIGFLTSWYRKASTSESSTEVIAKKSTPYRAAGEVSPEEPISASTSVETQTFPLDKILRESAEEYCRRVGKKGGDYLAHGVCVGGDPQQNFGLFVGLIPKNAEVVVEYQAIKFGSAGGPGLKGIALIPQYETTDTGGPVPVRK